MSINPVVASLPGSWRYRVSAALQAVSQEQTLSHNLTLPNRSNLVQSHDTDTWPSSPNTDPVTRDVRQDNHQRTTIEVTGLTRPGLLVGWLVGWLAAYLPSNIVYLRDGSAQTISRAATLRYKLQIILFTSPSHSILTPSQPVPWRPYNAWQGSHWSANL